MSMQYLLRATALVFVLFAVIGLTACDGGGGGGSGSPAPAPTPTPTPTPPPSTVTLDVDSTRGWQTTTFMVTNGQTITFSTDGSWTVDYRSFPYVGGEGYPQDIDAGIFQGCKLDAQLPYGTLLARVGNSSSFWAVGSVNTFTADHDGLLALRIHDGDGCLGDNGGSLTVTAKATEKATLKITWQNSYIYQGPGAENLYWYAQVVYENMSKDPMTIRCSGRTDRTIVKQHTATGTFNAIETYCSRNPGISRLIDSGGAHYEWAIFDKVPASGNVALEWGNVGTSQGVNPWATAPYPSTTPHPTECPPTGPCQSQLPEGKTKNLIVLVHGCCTDSTGIYEWRGLADVLIGEILKSETPGDWEVIVWDWTAYTPKPKQPTVIPILDPQTAIAAWIAEYAKNFKDVADQAYDAVSDQSSRIGQGSQLKNAIALAINNSSANSYEYIHFIGHSAGSKLIHEASQKISTDLTMKKRPFLQVTFLDAYTRSDTDKNGYGSFADYAEHYVDKGLSIGPSGSTDECLTNAFNFDITSWAPSDRTWPFPDAGHNWPRYWYEQSVTTRFLTVVPTLAYGYGHPLSLEGGTVTYTKLAEDYPKGRQCVLKDRATVCITGTFAPKC